MKKLVALLLALMLCLGVALAETAEVAGVWYFNEMSDGEMTINPATLGMDMTMTLNEDGTASMDTMGEVVAGTWAVDGENVVITFDGDPMTLAPVEGNLVGNQDETTMIFGREKAEVETFVLGEAKTDATMADYNGTWNATMVDMLGMQLPVAEMGMMMQITVADGKVTVQESEGEEPTAAEGTATVENGVLSIMIEGDTVATPLQLHEGDVLAMVVDMGEGMVMSMYFEKIPE